MKALDHLRSRPTSASRGGFTLAEIAVTIAIVALVLTMMLQGLEGAKYSAAHTRYRKTAYELAVGMLGEISAGLWQEELDTGMTGSFADLDEPDYYWEVALGDEALSAKDEQNQDPDRPFDNYAARRDWKEDQSSSEFDDEDEEAEEPFEKIKLRVTYPQLSSYPSDLTLELWVRWDQVYGVDEEDELSGETNVGGPPGENNAGNGSTGEGDR